MLKIATSINVGKLNTSYVFWSLSLNTTSKQYCPPSLHTGGLSLEIFSEPFQPQLQIALSSELLCVSLKKEEGRQHATRSYWLKIMTWDLIWYSFHVTMSRQVKHNIYSPPPPPKKDLLAHFTIKLVLGNRNSSLPIYSYIENLSAIPSVSLCTGLSFNSSLEMIRVCTTSDVSLGSMGGSELNVDSA